MSKSASTKEGENGQPMTGHAMASRWYSEVESKTLLEWKEWIALHELEDGHKPHMAAVLAKIENVKEWQLHIVLLSRIIEASRKSGTEQQRKFWCDRLGERIAVSLKEKRPDVLSFAANAFSKAKTGDRKSKKRIARYDVVIAACRQVRVRNSLISRRLAWQALPSPRPPILQVKGSEKETTPTLRAVTSAAEHNRKSRLQEIEQAGEEGTEALKGELEDAFDEKEVGEILRRSLSQTLPTIDGRRLVKKRPRIRK